jgi:phospholipase C
MPPIKHVFVLMLENRSFDHMLGLSGLPANGLNGREFNHWNGIDYLASPPPVDPMKVDPYHEFEDVVEQLCGSGVVYPPGGPYPPITNSGYVANFVLKAQPKTELQNRRIDDVMRCFPPRTPHVLFTLAEQFAVCDSWFSSMPGPTWPNRFFALAASSGGLDYSPGKFDSALWQTLDGFEFEHGSIFDSGRNPLSLQPRLNWRIYAGHKLFTLAHALKGVHIWDITGYPKFARDISDPNYPAQFTWIEPNYGNILDFTGGNSQHPIDGVPPGEGLIKEIYEAIRKSPLWESSMLVIVWDEHGGFYDHVVPPPAVPPGDKQMVAGVNKHGFIFDQYGPRVPAVVISPLIPRGTIDSRRYDHASIPATVERLFNLPPLTDRDRSANDVLSLASLSAPRADAPMTIPLSPEGKFIPREVAHDALEVKLAEPAFPDEPIETNRQLPGFLYVAARTDAELQRPPYLRRIPSLLLRPFYTPRVLSRLRDIRTRGDAHAYLEEIRLRAVAAEAAR